MAAVCQPDAAKPLNKVSRAAASSRCIGCGSNWAANRLISSSVTLIEPLLNFMPSAKSSNHSIMSDLSDTYRGGELVKTGRTVSCKAETHATRGLRACVVRVAGPGRRDECCYCRQP